MQRHVRLSAIPFAIAACLLAGACGSKTDPPGGTNQGAGAGAGGGTSGRGGRGGGPIPVTTALVQKKPVPVTISSFGNGEAQQIVQIRAQVTGELSAVHFMEGQEVRKGDELFTIDPRPFQAALAQAEAVLARDTATSINAQAQRTRYEDLFKRQLISRDQYDAQVATSDAAKATLEADRAAVETARLNLQFTHIIAPISGRTGSLGVHQGDLIRANDTNPMVTINQLSPIYVTFAVPGRYLADTSRYQVQKPLTVHARGQAALPPGAQPPPPPVLGSLPATPSGGSQSPVGQQAGSQTGAPPTPMVPQSSLSKAEAAAGMLPGALETGHVSFIDNFVDPTTGTIKLKATFENGNHALWPGQFLQVTLDLATEDNAIVIPAGALQQSQSGQFVYVVKPDRSVDVRNIVILRQQGEEIVIAQGLQPGEEVVTEGQLRLTPGARITSTSSRGNPEEPAGASGGGAGPRRGRGPQGNPQ